MHIIKIKLALPITEDNQSSLSVIIIAQWAYQNTNYHHHLAGKRGW